MITLLQIIAEAAIIEGFDVKTSELHGLSQRGGSVEVHIRFGKRVYSPLISLRGADLILGLELLEGLRMIPFANSKTIFLFNKNIISFPGSLAENEIVRKIKTLIKGKKYIVPASEICQNKLDKEVVSGICLLGYAIFKKLIPLKQKSILGAISKVVPEKYLELNREAFQLAKK